GRLDDHERLMLPHVRSLYLWEGKISDDQETLMIVADLTLPQVQGADVREHVHARRELSLQQSTRDMLGFIGRSRHVDDDDLGRVQPGYQQTTRSGSTEGGYRFES